MTQPLLSPIRMALFALATGILLSNSAQAQDDLRDVVDQQMSWYMLFGNHRLTRQLGLHTEYQFRRTGLGADWQQSLLRFGLDWHRDDQHVVTGGYGWIRSFPYGEQPIAETFDEHRIWQQLVIKSVTGQFKWVHRYRLEQRLMQFSSGSRWQHRARYFMQVKWPVPNHPEWAVTAYEEAFIGLRALDTPVSNLLQQNRMSVALNRKWEGGTSVQVGYLRQVLIKGRELEAERNHVLLVGLRHNLDFRD
ncbi:MAG: DUF2490 domain-containing protein [Flavobacteriales bacterium]